MDKLSMCFSQAFFPFSRKNHLFVTVIFLTVAVTVVQVTIVVSQEKIEVESKMLFDLETGELKTNPALEWNTFMGSSNDDYGAGIAIDGSGNVYVTGFSYATWGLPVNSHAGGSDAFAAKLNSSGVLQWHTFMGSSSGDIGYSVVVDGNGNVYVGGYSNAAWGSPVNAYVGGDDAFVAKLNSSGVLQWHTFMGSASDDYVFNITLDGSGNTYVCGRSYATWGSPVNSHAGGIDAFASKLNGSGILQWHTFMGSTNNDDGQDIAIDGNGNVYVGGNTNATWGAPVNAYSGMSDAFAVKLNSSGVLQWNTFMGSANDDEVYGIAIDGSGEVYVTGWSNTTWGSPVNPHAGGYDVFTGKLNSSGVLQWHTFMGSAGEDWSRDIAVDVSDNAYVTGYSDATWGTPLNEHAGMIDAFTAKLNSSGILQWHTFMGSSSNDYGRSISVDGDKKIYVSGSSFATWSTPVNPHAGNHEAFAVKLGDTYEALPTIEGILEEQGQCHNRCPCFSNFGFDDDTGLDDGWYQMDSYTGEWTILFADVSETSWDSDGWCIPESLFLTLSEGNHTIYFKASDDDGNMEGETGEWSWQFYKDITPPNDPTDVSSPSHNLGEWSNDNTIDVIWTDATDFPEECGVEGYSFVWDNFHSTLPDETVEISESVESTTSPELPDGSNHYFHIRSKDVAGNWQNTVHLGPILIDVTSPTVMIECEDTIRSLDSPCFSYQGEDNLTPDEDLLYSYFRVGMDAHFSEFDPTDYVCWDNLLMGGPYTLWVKVKDLAKNTSPTDECTFYYFPECSEFIKGDVNGDCAVNILDVVLLSNCCILEVCPCTEEQESRGDINGPPGNCDGDGRLNVLDSIKIVNIILGRDECQYW